MSQDTSNRRQFLKLCAIGAGATVLLAACGEKKPAAGGAAAAPAGPDCKDLSALTDAQRQTRASLKYVDVATDAKKRCDGCSLFNPATGGCGGCKVVPGPIEAGGSCTAWAPRPA
jgi:hypothetical protein